MNLTANIGAQFEVNAEEIAAKGYTEAYIIVVHNGVSTKCSVNLGEEDGLYIFEYAVAAKEMNDTLEITAYAEKDGVTYVGSTMTWSVKDGILSRLDLYYPHIKYAQYKKVCVLLADMLVYGAAAQERFTYKTDALVTEGVNPDYLGLATSTAPTLEAENTAGQVKKNQLYTCDLGLETVVELQFTYYLKSRDYANYEVWVVAKGETYKCKLEAMEGYPDFATAVFGELLATDMREVVSVALYYQGAQVSETATVSIEGTAKEKRYDENIAIVDAMMKYGDSAAKAFS